MQLDDVDETTLQRLEQAAFMTIETSPGNFQAWVAVESGTGINEKDIGTALRRGTGADTTASGATRLAGSRNFKEKYAPDYPYIAITKSSPGLVVNTAQMEEQGLLSLPSHLVLKPILRLPSSVGWTEQKPRRFPDYQRCLHNAPPNSTGDGQDITRADFIWCIIAIDWGWSVEETAAQLLKERVDHRKRHRNGEGYAELTAKEAAKAVENNWARRGR